MGNWLQNWLANAPPGQSPYAYAIIRIANALPHNPSWFFWMLALGSLVNAVNLGMNLVCVYIISSRRKAGESSPFWIVRLRYDHSSGMPYLVPSALMTFLVFNAIFALLMQPYVWINYAAYMDRTGVTGVRSGLFFWYGFIFVFDGSGMWISAFGTFYSTLLPQLLISNKISTSKFYLHPIFLNTLCYGLPAVLFVIQVATSVLSQIAWSRLILFQVTFVQNLEALDYQWSTNNHTVDLELLGKTIRMANPLWDGLVESRAAFVRNAITCGAWYFLCFLFFTPSAVWLLYVLRRTITHKLQYVTRMPTSVVDIQLPHHGGPCEVGLRPDGSVEHIESVEENSWRPKTPAPVAVRFPGSSCVSFGELGNSSGYSSPVAAGFFVPRQPPPSTTTLEVGLSGGETSPQSFELTESSAGGGPLGLDMMSTSAQATKKLQTAYYSAMLQFAVTGFCLAVACASWIWAAADERVNTNAKVHATAIIMTVWIYPLVGIIVNAFICVRLQAIGSTRSVPKPRWSIMCYLREAWSFSSRSTRS